MSESQELTYVALITLTIPGEGQTTSLTVTLAAADSVPVNGRFIPLGDCTVADLQAYADELEADVWDTYEEITLLALDEDERVEVSIDLTDEQSTTADWSKMGLVLPAINAVEQANAEASETAELTFLADLTDEDQEIEDEDDVLETAAAENNIADPETAAPDVMVAEPESVFPEIEEEVDEDVEPEAEDVTAVVDDTFSPIQRSKARVRVAGQKLPGGNPTWAATDILIDEPALRASQAHALSSMNREVAGFLIGPRPEKQPDGRYVVHIIDTIVAKHTLMQGASVTYTPESWRSAHDTLAERYPDETAVMVGWYHTHPGFGIFLSGMDLFIHETFYTQIWHVAFVLDPRARTSGFFCWDRYKSRVSRHDFAWPYWASGSW